MDYKELVEAMRSTDVKVVFCRSIDAADAIETLLAERDAAVEEIRGMCGKCKYFGVPSGDPPCNLCYATGGNGDYWKWRGPQKGDGHGDLPPV